ncbi:Protein kinase alk2, partial [Podila verticillata]
QYSTLYATSGNTNASWPAASSPVSYSENLKCLDDVDKQVPFASAFDELLSISSKRRAKTAQDDQYIIAKPCYRLVEKHRREGFHGAKKDLLQWFLEANDVEGRDTTVHSLSWIIYSIHCTGAAPEVIKNLVREVDNVLQDKLPPHETYKQQKYAEASSHESLRLCPVVPRNLKICVKDDVLPDDTKIYPGERITWSSFVMDRSKTIWGEHAPEYKPSPLGQQFGTVEAMTAVAMIPSKFTIEQVNPDKHPQYGVSISMPML